MSEFSCGGVKGMSEFSCGELNKSFGIDFGL
jgi:hypothetical protein